MCVYKQRYYTKQNSQALFQLLVKPRRVSIKQY